MAAQRSALDGGTVVSAACLRSLLEVAQVHLPIHVPNARPPQRAVLCAAPRVSALRAAVAGCAVAAGSARAGRLPPCSMQVEVIPATEPRSSMCVMWGAVATPGTHPCVPAPLCRPFSGASLRVNTTSGGSCQGACLCDGSAARQCDETCAATLARCGGRSPDSSESATLSQGSTLGYTTQSHP